MNIPTKDFKVKVGGFNVPVMYRDDDEYTRYARDGNPDGMFVTVDELRGPRIFLHASLLKQPNHRDYVFFHELMHCACYACGLKSAPKLNEEYIVHSLANTLLQVIKDNPKIFSS